MSLIEQKRTILFYLVIVVILVENCNAVTRQQLKNAGKLVRKQCLGKIGVPEEKISGLEKGKFIEERDVMCYMACVYTMTQFVKNNKLSYESSLKQVDLMYPADMREPVKATIEQCKEVYKKYDNVCEGSFWTAKCAYEANPKVFVFP